MYTMDYAEDVTDDLEDLCAYERAQILDAIEMQLTYQPTRRTRNQKPIEGLIPPWEYVPPVWELRVGNYRVFYDVDEAVSVVMIRAIRYKPPHVTTEDIL